LKFTEWMRSTGITAKQIKDRRDGYGIALSDGRQSTRNRHRDLFDKMRPYLPEVPEEIERLVAERTGIEWTAYRTVRCGDANRRSN